MLHVNDGIIIDYQDLIKHYEETINYAMNTSDVFSIIAVQKKPYSVIPPLTNYDEFLQSLDQCLVNKIINVKGWPGTETRNNHKVICIYNCCKFSRNVMLKMSNIFQAFELYMPEDICFYRNDIAWLVTVSHEKYAFMYNTTKEDIIFLKKNKIKYSPAYENTKYFLHDLYYTQ